MKRMHFLSSGIVLLLLISGVIGCDLLEDTFGNEKEASGLVEAIADDDTSITVDGIAYRITSDTKYDGLTGLADLSIGSEVEIEYEESGGVRVAVEVELGADDDD